LAVAGDHQRLQDFYIEDADRTLRQLLSLPGLDMAIATVDEPLDPALLDRPVSGLMLNILDAAQVPANARQYALPGALVNNQVKHVISISASERRAPSGPMLPLGAGQDVRQADRISPRSSDPLQSSEPLIAPEDASESAPLSRLADPSERMSEGKAVAIAYREQAIKLAGFLRARLSVLVHCEKLIAGHLCACILAETRIPDPDGRGPDIRPEPVYLEMPPNQPADPLADPGGGRLAELRRLISELKPSQVLVIRHLDLMGGGDRTPGREAREMTELIYSALDRTVLAFADPSMTIPEVITARFAVRAEVQGLPRQVPDGKGGHQPIEAALVTAGEADHFVNFRSADLYKHIAGLNPARLRQAMAYAIQMAHDDGFDIQRPAPLDLLLQSLRAFKAQTTEQFTVPDVRFEDIGGYDDVKAVLQQAIRILSGAGRLPDEGLRTELVPRGFLFHGPPGTGKTLFAKAIANRLNATIRVVSGPEVTDMYVGESERKVRVIFAEARRNAPSVIVFDEFDSIAASRTGRDDGGSRAGNALVAQILTEMDGFRPDVPILVVGTTNRLNLIDKALLRPSRFQPVAIGLPNAAARRRIAEIHARHFKIAVKDEMLDLIAESTEGLNGDEIRSVFRDAAVGLYCDGIVADAGRLGYLVGKLRTRIDAETIHAAEQRPYNPADGRRRPGAGHSPLTATSPPPTAVFTPATAAPNSETSPA
jgi:transitional endoplasmic reticulum ATPase